MRFCTAMSSVTILSLMLLGCFDSTIEPVWPDTGTIIAEVVSPDEEALAMVISNKERGTYQFEIREYKSGDSLAQREISSPIGYHEHVVSIVWLDSRQAEASIDRDFGDNDIKFTLSY